MRVLLLLLLTLSLSFAQEVIKIGAALSLTGRFAKEGQLLKQGYDMWLERVNAQGGIKIGNKRYKVELVYYDDQSDPTTTARLVERLITQDNIKLILGPYGSPQVFSAAPVVEKYGAVMVQAGGASNDIYQKGYRRIFGLYTVATEYGRTLVEYARRLDPSLKRIAVVYAKDIFSEDSAEGAKEAAKKAGMELVLYENYPKGTQDLSGIMQKLRLAKPDLVIGCGHFADSVLMVKQMKESGINPKFLAFTIGPALPSFVDSLKADAEGIFGVVQWSPALNFKDPLFGSTKAFVEEYVKRYGADPEYHVAGGVAAGIVLQTAIERAKSTDPDKVIEELRKLRLETLYGLVGFDSAGRINTKPMVVIQIQKGKRITLFPVEEAKPVYPKPAWK